MIDRPNGLLQNVGVRRQHEGKQRRFAVQAVGFARKAGTERFAHAFQNAHARQIRTGRRQARA